jgi:hypothetical protein
VIIIASGRYIDGEMAAEIGRIPPAFLPVGNRRLYEHQIALLGRFNQKIILTLPSDFEVPEYDRYWLERADIEVIYVDANLTLGESIGKVVSDEMDESNNFGLGVLFGDTLFSEVSTDDDVYSIGYQEEFYPWGVAIDSKLGVEFTDGVEDIDLSFGVLSGWFKLSNVNVFLAAIIESNESFFQALTLYAKNKKMKAIELNDWLDFGHLHTYFHSKAKRTTERSFNSLRIQNRRVLKKSEAGFKIAAEANWFELLPNQLKLYAPIYLGMQQYGHEVSYETEYMYLSTLSELFVHGKLPDKVWLKIFESCRSYLNEALSFKPTSDIEEGIKFLLVDKNIARVQSIHLGNDIDLNMPVVMNGRKLPSVIDLTDILISEIKIKSEYQGLLHGDFCFSNIMYDFRVGSIKVIDPRGTLDGKSATNYGDLRYDCAKFFHSIVGYYDLIVAERYSISLYGDNKFGFVVHADDRQVAIKELFMNSELGRFMNGKEVFLHMILLFLSMVPLHKENEVRQLALLLNAYRLYLQYEGLE